MTKKYISTPILDIIRLSEDVILTSGSWNNTSVGDYGGQDPYNPDFGLDDEDAD